MCTFLYQLPPAFAPFCELLCVGLLNTCPLMKTGHQIVSEAVAIVDAFHCTFVVTNLTQISRDKHVKMSGKNFIYLYNNRSGCEVGSYLPETITGDIDHGTVAGHCYGPKLNQCQGLETQKDTCRLFFRESHKHNCNIRGNMTNVLNFFKLCKHKMCWISIKQP